jgi:TRAP-type transport system periplasmic protein
MMNKTLIAAMAFCASTSAWCQAKWDMPTGYPVASFHTQNIQQFSSDVDKATAGKLKITVHPNASLFKANEIKRAVQTGQVQAGEFILSGASNEAALFGLDSIPFLATSYPEARKLYDISRPALEKLLSSQGIKLLFTVPWPPQGLYSTKPVESFTDLKGTKMRAYNPATSRIAQYVGAQPVTIQLAELSQALATGAVDNFLTSSASGIENKLYEQTKFFYDVNAWLPKNAVVVNQAAFDQLDKGTRDAVLKAAVSAESRGWALSQQKDDDYVKELSAKGMKVSSTNDGLKKELKVIGGRMTTEWQKTAGDEGAQIIEAFRKP